MASAKEYLDYILEQLSGLDEISYHAMMGEYILYFRGKIIGGIYDNKFLIKPVNATRILMPDAQMEIPYDGAKEMLLVDNVDDTAFLKVLVEAIYPELPEKKRKNKTEYAKRRKNIYLDLPYRANTRSLKNINKLRE